MQQFSGHWQDPAGAPIVAPLTQQGRERWRLGTAVFGGHCEVHNRGRGSELRGSLMTANLAR